MKHHGEVVHEITQNGSRVSGPSPAVLTTLCATHVNDITSPLRSFPVCNRQGGRRELKSVFSVSSSPVTHINCYEFLLQAPESHQPKAITQQDSNIFFPPPWLI